MHDEVDKALIRDLGERIPDSAWRQVEVTDTHIVSEATIEVKGKPVKVQRREFLGEKELLEINKHLYETSGRFSQREVGAIGTPVANIPLSMIYNPKTEIAEKMRGGDRDHLRWWLNRDENQPFRTQKGKL